MFLSPYYPTNACVWNLEFEFDSVSALGFKIQPLSANRIRYKASNLVSEWQSTLNEIFWFPFRMTLQNLTLEFTDLTPSTETVTTWDNLTIMETKDEKMQNKSELEPLTVEANKQTLPIANPLMPKTYVENVKKQANMPRFDIGYETTRGKIVSLEELSQTNSTIQIRKEPLDFSKNYMTGCQIMPREQGLSYFAGIVSVSLIC